MTKLHSVRKSRGLSRIVKLKLIVVLSAVWIAGEAAWFTNAQSLPTDAAPTCIVTPTAFASWFQSGSVSLNGVAKPADSVSFPNLPNCSFYQWSEQMFLWLTSPTPGGGRILDSSGFFDVSPPDANLDRTYIPHTPDRVPIMNVREAQVGEHGLPVILDKQGRLFEVEESRISSNAKQLILDSSDRLVEIESATIRNRKPVLRDRAGRTIPSPKAVLSRHLSRERTVQRVLINGIPTFFDAFGDVIDTDVGQAGRGEVLQAQNGSLVYYRTTVNDVFAFFQTGVRNSGIVPTPTQFPTTSADLSKIITFAAAHGKVFSDPNALAIEVKTSWVEAAGLPNLSSYITMEGTIPTFDKSNPAQWVPNGQTTVQLALVGMHVVGSTAGHPEMIWATFEHFENTPNAAYSYNSTTGLKTIPQNTAGTWLFCSSGAVGPFNSARMKRLRTGNIIPTAHSTIGVSDTMRQNPFGAASNAAPNPLDTSAADSNTEIISINNSVLGQLLSGDVRKNYFMMGATWTIGGAASTSPPNFGDPGNPSGNAVGTSQLANSTMETYQQAAAFSATGNNCFSCHTTNTTRVSHIFQDMKPLFP